MIVVTPVQVTVSTLTSSNVPETDAAAWSAGSYNTGQQVIYNHRVYEVVASPSTTDIPATGAAAVPPTWLDLGPDNRWKMFDDGVATQTSQTGTVVVTVTPAAVVNAVALFNLIGSTARVKVTDPVDGIVYNTLVSLVDNALITSWYSYFFEPITQRSDVVFLDMPQYINAAVQITIDGDATTAAIGEAVLGRQATIGAANFGTSVGIRDYSRKDIDDFGNAVIVERNFSKRASFDVSIETPQVDAAQQRLASLRATPAVYIGDESYGSTIVFGFAQNFQIVLAGPTLSDCSLDVEGLT